MTRGPITTAGAAPARPTKPDRKALTREAARLLRAAQSDDDAAAALEAVIELARSAED